MDNIHNFDVSDIPLMDYVTLSCATQIGLIDYLKQGDKSLDDLNKLYSDKINIIESLVYSLATTNYLIVKDGIVRINPRYSLEFNENNLLVFKNYDWYFLIAQYPILKIKKRLKISEETFNRFIDISEKISKDIVPFVVQKFPNLLSEKCSLLDLGCGKMGLSRYLVGKNDQIQITGIDSNEYSLNFLKEYIKLYSLSNQIKLHEGDVVENINKIQETYDFILMSHLLHWIAPKKVKRLLKQAKRLLAPNGVLVIYEDYLSEDKQSPKSSVRKNLSLSMLGYKIFSEGEIRSLLKQAGFKIYESKLINERRILIYSF